MPLYKGNTKIGAIYKGTTPIGKIYKGTDLIFESARWLTQNYPNLYYDLIPTTISSRQVKNKARVKKIYGNGVIENQLVPNNSTTQTINDVVFTNNNDGSWTLSGTASANTTKATMGSGTLLAGHKYLLCGCPQGGNINTYSLLDSWSGALGSDVGNGNIVSISANKTFQVSFSIKSGTNTNGLVFKPQLVDLTLMFGTGQEPTTLTDNRIVNILNRGYIPYNTGTYKGTNVGGFVVEPYNLFDGSISTENGYVGNNGNVQGSANFNISQYISVVGGKTYVLENVSGSNPSICFYDKDKTFVFGQNYNDNQTITVSAPQNAVYAVLSIPKSTASIVCFHVTGTRTGYAEHGSQDDLVFPAQVNGALQSHDTIEKTKTEWVFTKNTTSVDLGTFTYTSGNAGNSHCFQASGFSGCATFSSGDIANIQCEKYTTDTGNNVYAGTNNKTISYTSVLRINDTAYDTSTDLATFKTAMSGVRLQYPLATPQVIRIPIKHLAIVDLGSLSYNYSLSGSRHIFSMNEDLNIRQSTHNRDTLNAYCCLYRNALYNDTWVNMDMSYSNAISKRLVFINNLFDNVNDFKNAMSGIYLFYETDSEVADFDLTMNVESGGTINAYWFKWRENQLQSPLTATGWTSDIGTYSATNDRKATITLTSDTGNSYSIMLKPATSSQAQTITAVAGHTYLITFKLTSPKANGSTNRIYIGTDSYNAFYTISAGVNYVQAMIKFNGTGTRYPIITLDLSTGNFAIGDVITIEDYQVNDITLGELDATNINDPRIQYIIEHGYIPTNTAGTERFVDCEVLPNVDLEVKCK